VQRTWLAGQTNCGVKWRGELREHHRTRTFGEEYLELLRRSGVEFDERYV
jgi:hypothetical protein